MPNTPPSWITASSTPSCLTPFMRSRPGSRSSTRVSRPADWPATCSPTPTPAPLLGTAPPRPDRPGNRRRRTSARRRLLVAPCLVPVARPEVAGPAPGRRRLGQLDTVLNGLLPPVLVGAVALHDQRPVEDQHLVEEPAALIAIVDHHRVHPDVHV